MKVLILNDSGSPLGGAEAMTLTLRDGLRERGHDARVFASTADSRASPSFADYTCFGTRSLRLQMLTRTANPSAARALRRALHDFAPDVVHVRMFLTQLSPLVLPLLRGVPSLYHAVMYESICPTSHKLLPDGSRCRVPAGRACLANGCLSPQAWVPAMVQLRLWRRWHGCFDAVVANSEAVRQMLLAYGLPGTVEVIPNGVPPSPPRPPLSSPPTVAFASRLTWPKGGDVLLRAFARVVEEIPEARLLVAGDGPQRPALAWLAEELRLTPRVTMLGQVPRQQLDSRLADAWVQAVPSRWDEPFGLVAAEAMMRGTAVVASRSGGLAEIVRDGLSGRLVPPGDADALSAALVQILGDRFLAESMGRAGREIALGELDAATCVERFVTLYARLQ